MTYREPPRELGWVGLEHARALVADAIDRLTEVERMVSLSDPRGTVGLASVFCFLAVGLLSLIVWNGESVWIVSGVGGVILAFAFLLYALASLLRLRRIRSLLAELRVHEINLDKCPETLTRESVFVSRALESLKRAHKVLGINPRTMGGS